MPKRLTKEEFIKRSIEVHDDFYDYSKVEYINNSTKVYNALINYEVEITD